MEDANLELIAHIFRKETQGIRLYEQLILLAVEAAVVFIYGATAGKKRNISKNRLTEIYLFIAYLGFLFTITIFRRPFGSRERIVHLDFTLGFNSGEAALWINTMSVLNILLFIPFGILGSTFFKSKGSLKDIFVIAVLAVVLSLFIETTQLYTGTGMFEISDILTNSLGCLIGAVIFGITKRRGCKKSCRLRPKSRG